MATHEELRSEQKKLTLAREARTSELITVSGWYQNTDGTFTHYVWSNGRLRELDTVAAENLDAYKDLDRRMLDAAEREYFATRP